jgi:hypothetical protein
MGTQIEETGGIPKVSGLMVVLTAIVLYAGMIAWRTWHLEPISWDDLFGLERFRRVFLSLSAVYLILFLWAAWLIHQGRRNQTEKPYRYGFIVGAASGVLVGLNAAIQHYASKVSIMLEWGLDAGALGLF